MTPSRWMRPIASVALALLVFFGAPMAATAAPEQDNVRVVTYDASQAAEFQDAVDKGAQVWNNNVQNVRLEKAEGGQADVTILADDGWPRTMADGLGAGTIWMGRQAVNEGYDTVRIAAHELGHIYGLPDDRTGVCADLMSGASASPDCDNAKPNPQEAAEVEDNFANGVVLPRRLFDDSLVAR